MSFLLGVEVAKPDFTAICSKNGKSRLRIEGTKTDLDIINPLNGKRFEAMQVGSVTEFLQ
ncbi:hypothetical protein [Shimazuella alba]|uniref:Uncharacterized protein n=1 Tax=Shimazuella alba TaxID=2690964 RepID=A0A6I4W001_9BACL|nr:hypothetical protein [Shimazuella alba]MXQ54024.1 hypothetical protein [Shimazuella alba]